MVNARMMCYNLTKRRRTAITNFLIFIFVVGIIVFSVFIGWQASKLFNQCYEIEEETPNIVVPKVGYENFQGKG